MFLSLLSLVILSYTIIYASIEKTLTHILVMASLSLLLFYTQPIYVQVTSFSNFHVT
jgi:hypothetical protein